jgi:ribonuclease T2
MAGDGRRYILAVIVFFALVIPVWYLFHHAEKKKYAELGKDYKFLQLVLQWGPGVCYNNPTCTGRVSADWTIHGLWPSVDFSSYPDSCASKCSLNVGSLNGYLLTELEEKWPTLNAKGNTWFWDHEYCKHGTCCADILPEPALYFHRALILRDKVNVGRALRGARINPTNEFGYRLSDVKKALLDRFKVKNIRLSCGNSNGKQVLKEIGFCFSKSMKLINCPEGRSNGCTETLVVYLMPAS